MQPLLATPGPSVPLLAAHPAARPPVPAACPVCGRQQFQQTDILWPELIRAWGLSESEVDFVNRQQGLVCSHCGCNLRSMTLAGAVNEFFDWSGTLAELVSGPHTAGPKILEINPAGHLHPYLQKCRNYEFAAYPEIDLQRIQRPDEAYDLVIHADTLEHVPDPILGLRECRRILKPKGCLLMSVPVVPSKLTRRRHQLPPSFHNNASDQNEDMRVWTEYGADFYLDLIAAGWNKFFIYTLGLPEALAAVGTK